MKLGTQVMFYPEVFLTSRQKIFTAMVIVLTRRLLRIIILSELR